MFLELRNGVWEERQILVQLSKIPIQMMSLLVTPALHGAILGGKKAELKQVKSIMAV